MGLKPTASMEPPVCGPKEKIPALVLLLDWPPRNAQGDVSDIDAEPSPPQLEFSPAKVIVSARAAPKRCCIFAKEPSQIGSRLGQFIQLVKLLLGTSSP